MLSIATHITPAKDIKSTVTPVKSDVKLLKPGTLGSTELKAGDYSVTADDTHVKFSKGGKVIAEVPIQWKDESSKARFTAVVVDGNQIKEIHSAAKPGTSKLPVTKCEDAGSGQNHRLDFCRLPLRNYRRERSCSRLRPLAIPARAWSN